MIFYHILIKIMNESVNFLILVIIVWLQRKASWYEI